MSETPTAADLALVERLRNDEAFRAEWNKTHPHSWTTPKGYVEPAQAAEAAWKAAIEAGATPAKVAEAAALAALQAGAEPAAAQGMATTALKATAAARGTTPLRDSSGAYPEAAAAMKTPAAVTAAKAYEAGRKAAITSNGVGVKPEAVAEAVARAVLAAGGSPSAAMAISATATKHAGAEASWTIAAATMKIPAVATAAAAFRPTPTAPTPTAPTPTPTTPTPTPTTPTPTPTTPTPTPTTPTPTTPTPTQTPAQAAAAMQAAVQAAVAAALAAVAPPPVPASSQTSAYEVLRQQLDNYGLGGLASNLVDYAKEGLTDYEAYERLRTTTQYKARFQGNQLRKANGMRELSEAEYVAKERALEQQFALYDLPRGFYDDPSDYANAIAADLGAGELGARLDARRQIVEEGAMTGVLAYAQQHYGLGTGDLIAFFIDPAKATSLFERMAKASQVGAAGVRTGFGDVSTAQAERLANLGIGAEAAAQGYSQATSLRELETRVGGEEAVTRDDLTSSIFDQSQQAREKVERVQGQRKARFQSGGGYADSKDGFAGLGSANTR